MCKLTKNLPRPCPGGVFRIKGRGFDKGNFDKGKFRGVETPVGAMLWDIRNRV